VDGVVQQVSGLGLEISKALSELSAKPHYRAATREMLAAARLVLVRSQSLARAVAALGGADPAVGAGGGPHGGDSASRASRPAAGPPPAVLDRVRGRARSAPRAQMLYFRRLPAPYARSTQASPHPQAPVKETLAQVAPPRLPAGLEHRPPSFGASAPRPARAGGIASRSRRTPRTRVEGQLRELHFDRF
jgi:hypothetical protein